MKEVVKDFIVCIFCVFQIWAIDTATSFLYDSNKFVILVGYPSPWRYIFFFIVFFLFHRYSPFRWKPHILIPFVVFCGYLLLLFITFSLSDNAHVIYGIIYNTNVYLSPLWIVLNSSFLIANDVILFFTINVIGICLYLWLVLYLGLHVFNNALSKLHETP